ncbi:MAG: hypothetical protein PHD32_04455 [Eubacteriales bacterium]|nr:hypothetical protein [Eubacteriales bacterium]
MKAHSRYETARKFLIFWCLFIGVGAVAGAAGMLAAPDGSALGMQTMLPYFQVLPFAEVLFQNFVFPGIALLAVNGIPNLVAAGLLLGHKKAGVTLGGLFGVTLMLWIVIQFIIFPLNVLSTLYFVFGLAQAATGYAAGVFCRQESFAVRREDYPRIGTRPGTLVVFFSRMGYTRRLAFETADALGADIWEIKATQRTQGTPGFWWCGRYGMHRWPMPIEEPRIDWAAYDRVVICSPIWVLALSAPVRSFCRAAAGKIKAADYVLVHFQRGRYENAVREMDTLLGIEHGSVRSVCCHVGRFCEAAAPGRSAGKAGALPHGQ